jgi:hypothetical protein
MLQPEARAHQEPRADPVERRERAEPDQKHCRQHEQGAAAAGWNDPVVDLQHVQHGDDEQQVQEAAENCCADQVGPALAQRAAQALPPVACGERRTQAQ